MHTFSKLENVKLGTPEGEETVGNLQAKGYFWCSTISWKTTVTCYSAVNDTMGVLSTARTMWHSTLTQERYEQNFFIIECYQLSSAYVYDTGGIWTPDGMLCSDKRARRILHHTAL